jgi:L,D-transpeptidase-like protein
LLTAVVVALFVVERAFIAAETFTEGVRVSPDTVTLKPGQYVWEPERAPEGPVLMVASITEQVAYVYRNGIRIARSSVSTGRPGHPTPTGVFTILEKEVVWRSTLPSSTELYNISQDPSEKNNVAAEHPETVVALQKRAQELAAAGVKPLFMQEGFEQIVRWSHLPPAFPGEELEFNQEK